MDQTNTLHATCATAGANRPCGLGIKHHRTRISPARSGAGLNRADVWG